MVERKLRSVTMIAAILAAVTVADVYPGALHRGFATAAVDVDIMTKPDNARDRENLPG